MDDWQLGIPPLFLNSWTCVGAYRWMNAKHRADGGEKRERKHWGAGDWYFLTFGSCYSPLSDSTRARKKTRLESNNRPPFWSSQLPDSIHPLALTAHPSVSLYHPPAFPSAPSRHTISPSNIIRELKLGLDGFSNIWAGRPRHRPN